MNINCNVKKNKVWVDVESDKVDEEYSFNFICDEKIIEREYSSKNSHLFETEKDIMNLDVEVFSKPSEGYSRKSIIKDGLIQSNVKINSKENIFMSIGENCITDHILNRYGLKSFSTPFSSARSNLDNILALEEVSYKGFVDLENLQYEYLHGKKIVRSIIPASIENIYIKENNKLFEFTHHDVISDQDVRERFKNRIDRMLDLRSSDECLTFFYHYRANDNSNFESIYEKADKFLSYYNNKENNFVIFSQKIVDNESDRKLEYKKISENVHCFIIHSLALWCGNDEYIMWGRNDDDLIKEMLVRVQGLIGNKVRELYTFLCKQNEGKMKVGNEGTVGRPRVALDFPTGERLVIEDDIDWKMSFENQPQSNVMWLLSLDYIIPMIKSGECDIETLEMILRSFLDFVKVDGNVDYINSVASSDHCTAMRIDALIVAVMHLEMLDALTELRKDVISVLSIFLNWTLADNNYHENNHGFMLCQSMLNASVFFKQYDDELSNSLLESSNGRILNYLATVFDVDGLFNENTVGYHVFMMKLLKKLEEFVGKFESNENLKSTVLNLSENAELALGKVVYPCGGIPPMGDSGFYPTKHKSNLGTFYFKESHLFILKTSESYFSLVCGSRSETHKHMDDSSITLRYKNKDLLIDSGMFTYDWKDPFRQYVLSQRGHSGVFFKSLDNLDRIQFKRKYPDFYAEILKVEPHDEYTRIESKYQIDNTLYVKRIVYTTNENEIIIFDEYFGEENDDVKDFCQRFTFSPESKIMYMGGYLVARNEEVYCAIKNLNDVRFDIYKGEMEPMIYGWSSSKFNDIDRNYCIDFIPSSTKRVSSYIQYGENELKLMSSVAKEIIELNLLLK
jgi:hypothetical protein